MIDVDALSKLSDDAAELYEAAVEGPPIRLGIAHSVFLKSLAKSGVLPSDWSPSDEKETQYFMI